MSNLIKRRFEATPTGVPNEDEVWEWINESGEHVIRVMDGNELLPDRIISENEIADTYSNFFVDKNGSDAIYNGRAMNTVIDANHIFGNTIKGQALLTVSGTAIPAYMPFIYEIVNIDMSGYNTVSTTGKMVVRRAYYGANDFTGDLFEIQWVKGHYQMDSDGSNDKYVK